MSVSCKKFFVLFLLSVLLFQGCAVGQAKRDSACISKTGTKYHRCDCSYLKNSSHQISIDEALKRNYTACSICKPDTTVDQADPVLPANEKSVISKPGKTDNNSATSTRCSALTKAGMRCKRMASEGGDKCWQHQ